MQDRLHCQGIPRDVVPSATVRHATASAGEIARLASTSSAAAGPRKATVWMCLRTVVTGTPRRTSPSASSPAAELPTAMTCTCARHGCTSLLSATPGTADCWANHKRGRTSQGRKARNEDDFMSSFSAWKARTTYYTCVATAQRCIACNSSQSPWNTGMQAQLHELPAKLSRAIQVSTKQEWQRTQWPGLPGGSTTASRTDR